MYLIFNTPSKVKETTLASSTHLPQVNKSRNSNNVEVTVTLSFGAANDYIKCASIVALRTGELQPRVVNFKHGAARSRTLSALFKNDFAL